MFSLDIDAKALERNLERIGDEALPRAMASTFNRVGRAVFSATEREIKRKFTLRNAFTLRGLVFWEAKPRSNIRRIDAVVGHKADYMGQQEEGFTVRAKRRRIPIPTRAARTGKRQDKPVARRYRMNRLSLGGNIFMGRPGDNRNKKLGIYQRMARGLRLIRDLTQQRYTVRATHWFSKPLNKHTRRNVIVGTFINEAKQALRQAGFKV